MKKLIIILISLFSLTASAFGPVFSYHLEIEYSGEGVTEIYPEEIEELGWKVDGDEWDAFYTLGKRNVEWVDSYMIKESLGDVEFTIRKTIRGSFEACLGMGYGDWDGSAQGCTYLHPGVNILEANGGEHASGAWSFSGKAVIHWKK